MRILYLSVLAIVAVSSGVLAFEPEWRKGTGSVHLHPFSESTTDQSFVRDYLANSPEQQRALDPRGEPPLFEIEDIWVGHYDLNDDGNDELILYFDSLYHCGRGGCKTIFFQGGAGKWREIGQADLRDIWVGNEKSGAYRVIYSSTGRGVRWTGESYQSFCAGFPADWERPNSECSCCRVYARENKPLP